MLIGNRFSYLISLSFDQNVLQIDVLVLRIHYKEERLFILS